MHVNELEKSFHARSDKKKTVISQSINFFEDNYIDKWDCWKIFYTTK